MTFELNLQSSARRGLFAALALALGIWLIKIIVVGLVLGTMSDRRLPVTRAMLEQTVRFFPASAGVLARLAEIEAQGTGADAETAEQHLKEAVRRSPRDFRYRLTLGEIGDILKKTAEAEQSYREAVRLAPQYSEAHWQLANFLLREGAQSEAFEYFRVASALNPKFLPASLELVWQTSNKNYEAVRRLAQNQPLAQVKLAHLLAAEQRMPEAIEVFSQVDEPGAAKSNESARFLDELVKKGYPRAAFELWKSKVEKNMPLAPESSNGVWNAGFEIPIAPGADKSFVQKFNWQLAASDYARPAIDSTFARTGAQSLALEFTGRDTTRLADEAKQLVIVQPGASYRVSFYAKCAGLKTPEGPKVSISTHKGEILASSAPVSPDQSDWTPLSFDFTAPNTSTADAVLLVLSVTRKPRYVYDAPTRGTIWFDDFALTRMR